MPGRGSLAEVLPESMKAFFVRALAVFDQVDTLGWTGVSRTRIQLGVVPSPDAHAPTAVSTVTIATPASAIDDFAPPAAVTQPPTVSTSRWLDHADDTAVRLDLDDGGSRSDRLRGVLIHRLFELGDRFSDVAAIPEAEREDRAAA